MASALELLLLAQALTPGSTRVIKPGDQSVPNTTLVNDTALAIPVLAGTSLVFVGLLSLTGAAIGSGDFKGQFTAPAGATVIVEAVGYSLSSAGPMNGNAVRGASATFTAGINGATPSPLILIGSVVVAATAGSLQLQIAQNSSSGTSTTVKGGSWLAAWQSPAPVP